MTAPAPLGAYLTGRRPETGALVRSTWVEPRRGLDAAWHALSRGPRAIAYLGLSVTAQRDGYRPLLHEGLVARTGHLHVAVNAGVGGVGSVSLVFLIDRLVLPHQPVICFVECTTGDIDGRTIPSDVPRAVEGILRKLLGAGCQPCVLHLYQRQRTWQIDQPLLADYERVADHYGVPSIHVGRRIERDLVQGALDGDRLFRDAVHTTAEGARVTTDLVLAGLECIVGGPREELPATGTTALSSGAAALCAGTADLAARLPPCCTELPYDRAVLRLAGATDCRAPAPTGRFRLQYPYVELVPGNAAVFEDFAAALKGLAVIVGPSSGMIRVATAETSRNYQVKDRWCEYDRLSTVVFDEALPAGARVTIEPLTPGSSLRVIGFLTLPR